jgi:hypothetical protein
VESLSVKSAVGGFGLFFGETQGLGRRYLVRVQPIQLFVKFDIVGSFWMFGGSAGGACQISPLFHEDDQDDQIN